MAGTADSMKLFRWDNVHIVQKLFQGTWWSSDSVMYFLEFSGAKDQLPGH